MEGSVPHRLGDFGSVFAFYGSQNTGGVPLAEPNDGRHPASVVESRIDALHKPRRLGDNLELRAATMRPNQESRIPPEWQTDYLAHRTRLSKISETVTAPTGGVEDGNALDSATLVEDTDESPDPSPVAVLNHIEQPPTNRKENDKELLKTLVDGIDGLAQREKKQRDGKLIRLATSSEQKLVEGNDVQTPSVDPAEATVLLHRLLSCLPEYDHGLNGAKGGHDALPAAPFSHAQAQPHPVFRVNTMTLEVPPSPAKAHASPHQIGHTHDKPVAKTPASDASKRGSRLPRRPPSQTRPNVPSPSPHISLPRGIVTKSAHEDFVDAERALLSDLYGFTKHLNGIGTKSPAVYPASCRNETSGVRLAENNQLPTGQPTLLPAYASPGKPTILRATSGARFIPASVQKSASAPLNVHPTVAFPNSVATRKDNQTSSADKKWSFHLLLANKFPEDKGWLASRTYPINRDHPTDGIHVFIDASNILIGFRQKYPKRARGTLHVANLLLLLERNRPVTKGIIGGSTRHDAPNEEHERHIAHAELLGYEALKYARVYKPKEISPTDKSYREQSSRGPGTRSKRTTNNNMEPVTSDSDGTYWAAPSWVEQGVDEGIQLRMLQSLLDYKTPATLVLASGDGNKAEYSDGFFKHVMRALDKGWKVEVVSWKQQLSSLYKRLARQNEWGERFRVIELDGWLEFLVEREGA
ncbi:hypothetical protein M011DRAFT_68360 [Sporormia fimetaria CBS 119925]|uniref:NYN domain-containing protein n=1 Tax=Sporormia fimetaria CBS 119925 TaxID=1340428 RepID=A0A6A6VCM1_9PLEO|nr:hypothetical protein M011DRAFT_68360 [Sporormia fimetaria CBS 119925]